MEIGTAFAARGGHAWVYFTDLRRSCVIVDGPTRRHKS